MSTAMYEEGLLTMVGRRGHIQVAEAQDGPWWESFRRLLEAGNLSRRTRTYYTARFGVDYTTRDKTRPWVVTVDVLIVSRRGTALFS